jgi:hypothetical protein
LVFGTDDYRHMKYRLVAGLSFIAIAAVGTGLSSAQERGLPPPRARALRNAPANGGTIEGRVFDANTNSPIRNAQVLAQHDENVVDAITDDEGRYRLSSLPPGQWRVSVSKGGYFTWEVGQRRPFEAPPPIDLAARERVVADVPLSRGGVITGRVSDDTGEPLAGLRVRVYRARMSQGYRRLEAVAAADATDDTGAYRIYGLPPGDYFVAASLRLAPPDSVVQTTYAPTYYPGTGDIAEAQRIRVTLGSETNAIFPLLPVRHVRVAGSVLASSGGPAHAFLTLTSESSELGTPLGIGGVTREDGTFTLPDVPPGRYVLSAASRNEPTEVASMPITIGSDDLSGVSLVTAKPATMRGRFVADAGVTRALPTGLEIVAVGAKAGGTVLSSSSDPVFELDELGEPFHLRVDRLPSGWTVKTILVNEGDVTDSPISLQLGQEAQARIVLTDRVAAVNGTVALEGRPSVEVVVFPEDATKWRYPSRYIRAATVDAKGTFRIAGLPAGERYLAIATSYLEDGDEYDPEFLDRVRSGAALFELREAETRALDLTVTER